MLKYLRLTRFSFDSKLSAIFQKAKKPSNILNQQLITRDLTNKMPRYQYPNVRRDDTISEKFHDTDISDPYRWLEDPESEETKMFVEEQNKLTNSFLEKTKYREDIRQR